MQDAHKGDGSRPRQRPVQTACPPLYVRVPVTKAPCSSTPANVNHAPTKTDPESKRGSTPPVPSTRPLFAVPSAVEHNQPHFTIFIKSPVQQGAPAVETCRNGDKMYRVTGRNETAHRSCFLVSPTLGTHRSLDTPPSAFTFAFTGGGGPRRRSAAPPPNRSGPSLGEVPS